MNTCALAKGSVANTYAERMRGQGLTIKKRELILVFCYNTSQAHVVQWIEQSRPKG